MTDYCHRCQNTKTGPGAFCDKCLAEIHKGNRFKAVSNDRPEVPEDAEARKHVCMDVDGQRTYDYDPKYRGRRRNG